MDTLQLASCRNFVIIYVILIFLSLGGHECNAMQVETLGKIRHRNIVKLLCCCSNEESNLLVYEYMPNGSLGDILHSTKGGTLDWAMRYKIALGAAQVVANP